MIHLTLFLRALAIVTMTAMNVVFITHGSVWSMLFSGALLSWIWVGNTRMAVRWDLPWTREAYAAGAGIGTALGFHIARWLSA